MHDEESFERFLESLTTLSPTPQWQTLKNYGRIADSDNLDYYIELSKKEYNGKEYIVLVKHRPWRTTDRPLAIPIEFARGLFKLCEALKFLPSNCLYQFGDKSNNWQHLK